jgi:hypothetical protein
MLDNIFLLFRLLPTFFRNVTVFLKNVGFVNYFSNILRNVANIFQKCWKKINNFFQCARAP